MGEVDPSFCPALVLSIRTAPDLGMVAVLQSSRWKRVTFRGERSWSGRVMGVGGEGWGRRGEVGEEVEGWERVVGMWELGEMES